MKITVDPRKAVLEDVVAAKEVLRFTRECRAELAKQLGTVPDMVDSLVAVAAVWYAGRMEPRQLVVYERP